MPLGKEAKFYQKVRRDLKKLPSTKFTKIQQMGRVGDSDIIMCVNGHYVEVEMKKDHKTWPTSIQMWGLSETKRCGGYAFVAYPANWDELYNFLLYLSGVDTKPVEIPKCLQLRQNKRGAKPLSMPLPE